MSSPSDPFTLALNHLVLFMGSRISAISLLTLIITKLSCVSFSWHSPAASILRMCSVSAGSVGVWARSSFLLGVGEKTAFVETIPVSMVAFEFTAMVFLILEV